MKSHEQRPDSLYTREEIRFVKGIALILATAAVAFVVGIAAVDRAHAAPAGAGVHRLQAKVKQLRHRLHVERRQKRSLRAQRDAARRMARGPIEQQVAALAAAWPPSQALSVLGSTVLAPIAASWPCEDVLLSSQTRDGTTTHFTLEVGTLFEFDGPCAS